MIGGKITIVSGLIFSELYSFLPVGGKVIFRLGFHILLTKHMFVVEIYSLYHIIVLIFNQVMSGFDVTVFDKL